MRQCSVVFAGACVLDWSATSERERVDAYRICVAHSWVCAHNNKYTFNSLLVLQLFSLWIGLRVGSGLEILTRMQPCVGLLRMRTNCYFAASDQNSDIAITFSNADFQKESNNLAIRQRFHSATFDIWSWTIVVHQVSRPRTLYQIWAKSNDPRLSYWSFSKFSHIFTALHWMQGGLIARKLTVRLSVRLSVKRVHCDKTEKNRSKFLYRTKDYFA